jgi:hypothetical protein
VLEALFRAWEKGNGLVPNGMTGTVRAFRVVRAANTRVPRRRAEPSDPAETGRPSFSVPKPALPASDGQCGDPTAAAG